MNEYENFVQHWASIELTERQSAQAHFEAVCRLLKHPLPHEIDPKGEFFAYEYGVVKGDPQGGRGYADVFYKGHFAIEYKRKGRYADLRSAYVQLQQYRENLFNPPLLVVCDIAHWEIHTNFPNTEKRVYKFTNAEIALTHVQRWLHHLFYAPEALHPDRNTAQVTQDAADAFQRIAENMRGWEADPERIAHFLTKLIFCLFAEDVELLPHFPNSAKGIFSGIIDQTRTDPAMFRQYVAQLFHAMADGGNVLLQKIPYFNGRLFENVQVEEVQAEALLQLANAANLNWASIEPAIFGTLFERSLDPRKRAQLGAHYTNRDDILLIVEPVLMQPLRREWDAMRAQAVPIRAAYDMAETPRAKLNRQNELLALRDQMLTRLRTIKVLDPACGSGNFLYVALNLLLDMEKEVINDPLFTPFPSPPPGVHPRQLYGMEIEPIAHALASIVVWIGYIQWRQNNGYLHFTEPILEPNGHNIRLMDAILAYDADGNPIEPEWEAAEVVVGNPPFLGGKKMRGELGDRYLTDLRTLYRGRLPKDSDLVTYWFERARSEIERGQLRRAGLLATNSIRDGSNREVLKRIKQSGDIFIAWSDREWMLDGAAVNISIIGFDQGAESDKWLDDHPVTTINANLTKNVDLTTIQPLRENEGLCFLGVLKSGRFDLSSETAKKWLQAPLNPNGRPNSDVIKPRRNGADLTGRPNQTWLIDFAERSEVEAAAYELPFQYVKEQVKPQREQNRVKALREQWWLLGRTRPLLRQKLIGLTRYLATPEVAKHRFFVWLDLDTVPDHTLHVIVRDDDYFFGVLHAKLHQLWALRTGATLEDRPRYTSTRTFNTFPFPYPPGKEPIASDHPDHAAYQAIASAAKRLHEERDAWLNPTDRRDQLKDRTLTNLYNALNAYRGIEQIRVKPIAGDFAPRLDTLHRELDQAVCAAYGWDVSILEDEDALLARLLALNLQRAQV